MNEWWTAQQSGLIGGIVGSGVGLLGAAYGVTAGFFAPKGKHRTTINAIFWLAIAVGAIGLLTGTIALIDKQPYHVWYPLLLIGVICTAVFIPNHIAVRRRYTQAEHRRFEAESLRRA